MDRWPALKIINLTRVNTTQVQPPFPACTLLELLPLISAPVYPAGAFADCSIFCCPEKGWVNTLLQHSLAIAVAQHAAGKELSSPAVMPADLSMPCLSHSQNSKAANVP